MWWAGKRPKPFAVWSAMTLRRNGGIRLLSFPPGDAEQVMGMFLTAFFIFPVQLFRAGQLCPQSLQPSSLPPVSNWALCHSLSSFTIHMSFTFRWMPCFYRGCFCLSPCFIISLSWLFLCFSSSSCPAGCGSPQASSFPCQFPRENHRS